MRLGCRVQPWCVCVWGREIRVFGALDPLCLDPKEGAPTEGDPKDRGDGGCGGRGQRGAPTEGGCGGRGSGKVRPALAPGPYGPRA